MDSESIARYADALHQYLTARTLAGWRPRVSVGGTAADLDLEVRVRAVLGDLDQLRYRHRRKRVGARRWIVMRAELDRVYRDTVEATG